MTYRTASQQKYKKRSIEKPFLKGWRQKARISTRQLNSFIRRVLNLSDSESQVLIILLGLYIDHDIVYVSQSNMGYCRQTANEIVGRLHKLGLINKTHRWFQTCLYQASRFFHFEKVKQELSDYLPIIKELVSISTTPTQEEKTLHKFGFTHFVEPTWPQNWGFSNLDLADPPVGPPNIPKKIEELPF
jgi:predicted transcriptional regulator